LIQITLSLCREKQIVPFSVRFEVLWVYESLICVDFHYARLNGRLVLIGRGRLFNRKRAFLSLVSFFLDVSLSSFSLGKKKKQKVQGKSKCSAAFAEAYAQGEQSLEILNFKPYNTFSACYVEEIKGAVFFACLFYRRQKH